MINVYCDESCHLEHDNSTVMVLGAVSCPRDRRKTICQQIRDIKEKYGIKPEAELKWVKVSESTAGLYLDLLDYFFNCPELNFRAIIADKTHLRHEEFHQSHDEWYYKMYYILLKYFYKNNDYFSFYVDIKDTYSYEKTQHLLEICRRDSKNKKNNIVKIQPIRSHEVEIMQLTDVLTGILSNYNRIELDCWKKNPGKQILIEKFLEREPAIRNKKTVGSLKTNIFVWESDDNG